MTPIRTLLPLVAFCLASLAVHATKRIVVDLDRQVVTASDEGKMLHEFHAVTGSCAKWTHPGLYTIDRKVEDYVSKTYDQPMPYSMFFTNDGKAIHGSPLVTVRSFVHAYVTDEVGSKGCVGLSEDNAKTLYEWAPIGTIVEVLPSERNPEEVPQLEE